jgi:hypothetical protein
MLQARISKLSGQEMSKESIFFVIGGKIPNHRTPMTEIYDKFKDEDGMLYVTYQEQERF